MNIYIYIYIYLIYLLLYLISETAFSYAKQLLELKNLMMQMVMENYGVEKHYELLVRSAFHLMRFIKYRTPKTNEINTGLRPHVDKTFLSVLAGNHVKGLQIETKDGEWIDFAPTPSAFLVIAGEGFTVGPAPFFFIFN